MDYYITRIDSDGHTTGPTRLLGVDDDQAALKVLKKRLYSHPKDKFTLEARATEDDIGKVVKRIFIEAQSETKRCPNCKRFVGKGKKCSNCLE
jgi:hypothetical protein